jgi:hypothetical protein
VKFLPEQPVAVQGEMANRSWLLTVETWPELNAWLFHPPSFETVHMLLLIELPNEVTCSLAVRPARRLLGRATAW